MKKIIFTTLIIFCITFFSYSVVFGASVLFEQGNDSAYITGANGAKYAYDGANQNITHTGSADTLHLQIKITQEITNNTDFYIGIFGRYENANWTNWNFTDGIANSRAEQSYYCFNTTQTNEWVDVYIPFPNNTTQNFTTGNNYRYWLVALTNSAEYKVCQNTADVGVGNGINWQIKTEATQTNIYHQTGTDLGGPTNAISITYPEDEATNVENFGLWQGNYALAEAVNYGSIAIRYGYSSSSFPYVDWEPITANSGNFYINRLIDLASSTTIYAYAQLWNNSVVVDTSPIISFSLGDVSGSKIFPVYPWSPISMEGENVFRNKFPFAYFYDIADIINAYNNTDENKFFEFSLSLFPNTAYATSTKLLSSSTLIEAIGQNNINIIKLAIKYVLWGGWVIFVYQTGKNLFKK